MRIKVKILTMAQAPLHATCFLLPRIMALSLILVSYWLVRWLKPQAYTASRPQGLCTCCSLYLECFMLSFCMLCSLPVLTSTPTLLGAHPFSSIEP